MLLLPLSSAAARDLPRLAVGAGALLVGRGPLPGSLVVTGRRSALLRVGTAGFALVLAAPPAGCQFFSEASRSR